MQTKVCKTCKQSKDLCSFQNVASTRKYKDITSSVKAHCKICQAYHSKIWRIKKLSSPRIVREVKNKKCASCGQIKNRCEFYTNKLSRDGLCSYCKICNSIRYETANTLNPSRKKQYHLKYKYGITPQEFKSIVDRQNGMCDLCQYPLGDDKICVDHNHETGKIRGVLHNLCNRRLSAFEISGFKELAFKYLDKYK